MLNKRRNLKQYFLLLLAGIGTSTALAQSCTQLLIASYTPGNVCTGRPFNLSANTISGATYAWTGPGGFSSLSQNPTIASATVNHTGSYIVTATAGSCIYKDTVNVTVNATPLTPTINANNPPCKAGNLSFGIFGPVGASIALYNPNGIQIPQNLFNLSSSHNGMYKAVAISNSNGCKSDTGYYSLQVIDLPTPTLLADTPICRGDTLHMYVMNNTPFVDNYYWNTPSSNPFYTLPQPLHLPNVTVGGFYTVQTVLDGCLSPVAYSAISFNPSVYASTTVTADGEFISGQTEITFTVHIINGGVAPTIQWFKNGFLITGATDTTYKGILLTDIFPMDWFYAQVQRDSACGGINYSDTMNVSKLLNVPAIGESEGVNLYPSPNTGAFTLQMPALNSAAIIEIVNSIGQQVFSTTIETGNNLEINLPAEVANGVYTLRLTGRERSYISRFTVNR